MYNGETLSVLLEYRSSERDDVMFNAVAQLPVKPVLNLANEAFGERALEWYVLHYPWLYMRVIYTYTSVVVYIHTDIQTVTLTFCS